MCAYSPVQPPAGTVVVIQPNSSGILLAAAAFNIIGAVLGFVLAGWYAVAGSATLIFFELGGLFFICAALALLGAILALFGGIFCIKRENWVAAIATTVLGMLFILPWGSICCFIALLLIVMGRGDFHGESQGPRQVLMTYAQPAQQAPQPVLAQSAGPQSKFCPKCGARMDTSAAFCQACGTRQA